MNYITGEGALQEALAHLSMRGRLQECAYPADEQSAFCEGRRRLKSLASCQKFIFDGRASSAWPPLEDSELAMEDSETYVNGSRQNKPLHNRDQFK